MAKLAISQAPAPAVPRRFLYAALLWGVLAGLLLTGAGDDALGSRWSGPVLALVHAVALGVLGNAMFGSLLQFVPVVVAAQVRGGRLAAFLLHVLLNLGSALLVVSLRWPGALAPVWGGLVLAMAFALLLAMLLAGVLVASGSSMLRWGIASALIGGAVTACLGVWQAMAMSGWVTLPSMRVVDVHAGWGLTGWVISLLAAVARVVMPMFHGTGKVSGRLQASWHAAVYLVLLTSLIAVLRGAPIWGLRESALVLVAIAALSGLCLQYRASTRRKTPLVMFWRVGLVAVFVAAIVLLAAPGDAGIRWAGVLGLIIGLPALVIGMLLEIAAFLGWIEVHRLCGRGMQVPGVHLLLPEYDKGVVLVLYLLAAALMVIVPVHPGVAPVAGLLLSVAYWACFLALLGIGQRIRRFISMSKVGCREIEPIETNQ